MNQYQCCPTPTYLRAWLICWPFAAKYCESCEEVISDAHPLAEWLFEWVFSHFWTGMVKVTYRRVN